MLRGYGDSHGCRREYLLTYFGEPYQGPCGNCDNCDAGRASAQPPQAARVPFPVDGLVRHEAWGEGRVLRYQDGGDKVVVLFDQAGYKTLSVATVLERELLESVRE
jgi:ATP-dependent DNA helicase RecQ